MIHFGLEPAVERESVQWRRINVKVASCGVRTIALHPVSQNFIPHRAFITTRIEPIFNISSCLKQTRGYAQCKGDTGILREIEGFGVWLCIRLFGDER